MLVKFFYHPVVCGTGEDGLPLYRDEVWVKINRDMTHTVERKADDTHFSQFRELYDAFLKATADYETLEGYPLEMWAALKPSEIQNFKTRGYRTVQDLIKANQSKMPPEFKVLIKRAKEFVELAGAGAGLTEAADQLSTENERLKEEMETLKKEIQRLKVLEEA